MQRHLKLDFVKPTFQATRSEITNVNTLYMEDFSKECETKCAGGVTVTKVPATTTQKAATDTAGPCDDTPSVTGICEAHTYAVTFRDGQCQQFIYGGCGATKNYFSSKAECEKLCLQA
ncbi:hypothetical protein EB796_024299 [Bugula neritina]|uniref:BPTI/Kunitz inhibitor domain-containing protein n=1 Tax=Bugula neritina TaxID=10212 RepID=A0A7J7IUA6_BUGNE|nr:hypothetical protein EB796_024299 [Bugula neritina]